ncbi:MAG: hypothetical protein VX127_13775 [Myxococcota bacterium]|nr:hypothetical protein [Myxococcota bacterium]
MRSAHPFLFSLMVAFAAGPALAADDDLLLDDDLEEEDEDDGVFLPRFDEEDSMDEDPDDAGLEEEASEFESILGSEAETVNIDIGLEEDEDDLPLDQLPPGTDNASIYRAQMNDVSGMAADEEGMAWEQYLQTYPNSVFRKQVEDRIDELSESMFAADRPKNSVDEGQRELNFSQAMLMEAVDPRSRIRAGFEWGYINWINLIIDYEHQLQRNMSVHGGLQHRYSGWSLEGGVRYALVKSTRTNLIVTAIGDVHLNLDPIAPGLRPLLAVGKRFALTGDAYVDVQAQAGPDLMLYPGMFSPRVLAGLNTTISPSDKVKIFIETTSVMKDLGWSEGESFRFNQIAFGMRFQGKGKSVIGTGASVPYSANYWRYHYGSVMADMNHYL